jgi:hypothetical protein
MVVPGYSIPLQKGKLRKMQISSFPLSPTPTDLKDLPVARCHHPLHAKFWRGMKEP